MGQSRISHKGCRALVIGKNILLIGFVAFDFWNWNIILWFGFQQGSLEFFLMYNRSVQKQKQGGGSGLVMISMQDPIYISLVEIQSLLTVVTAAK